MFVIVAALLGSVAPGYAEEAAIVQARTIANLLIRTVNCFTHPCIGDSESDVRQLLNRRLVSDGYFDYSDLATSYPSVRGVFQGVVEWNLEGTLKDIGLMIVNFQVPRDVLGAELERTLPDCNVKAGRGCRTGAQSALIVRAVTSPSTPPATATRSLGRSRKPTTRRGT